MAGAAYCCNVLPANPNSPIPSVAQRLVPAVSPDRKPDSLRGAGLPAPTRAGMLQSFAAAAAIEVEMAATPSATVAHGPIEVDWVRGSEFEAQRPGAPAIRIDGNAKSAPSPFDVLLAALATCAATDVVSILHKQRTPVTALHIRVEAQRVDATPRRLAAAALHFTITSPGATAAKVARAVELSITKYCSVRSSLLADVPVTWTIALEA
jgi:putative redox protein